MWGKPSRALPSHLKEISAGLRVYQRRSELNAAAWKFVNRSHEHNREKNRLAALQPSCPTDVKRELAWLKDPFRPEQPALYEKFEKRGGKPQPVRTQTPTSEPGHSARSSLRPTTRLEMAAVRPG